MTKAYWVARVDVSNEEAYNRYRALNIIAFEKYGAKFLVRGPAGKVAKGTRASTTWCWNSGLRHRACLLREPGISGREGLSRSGRRDRSRHRPRLRALRHHHDSQPSRAFE